MYSIYNSNGNGNSNGNLLTFGKINKITINTIGMPESNYIDEIAKLFE